MPSIAPTYASPGLRTGLLYEDWPEAEIEYSIQTGPALGIPPALDEDGTEYVVATIVFPDYSGKPPVSGWKAIPAQPHAPSTPGNDSNNPGHLSDLYSTLQTKAAGRALKRAGYPDDLQDLKAVVVWRQRSAEIVQIEGGSSRLAVGVGGATAALDAAGKGTNPDGDTADGDDRADAPERSEGTLDDTGPRVVEQPELDQAPTDTTIRAMRAAISELGPRSSEVTAWCKQQGWKVTRPETERQARAILSHARELSGAAAIDPDSGEVVDGEVVQEGQPTSDERRAEMVELMAGVSEDEIPALEAFCKERGIEIEQARSDPGALPAEVQDELLGWLQQ